LARLIGLFFGLGSFSLGFSEGCRVQLELLLESLGLLELRLGRLAHSACHRNLLLNGLAGHGSTSLSSFN